MKVINPVTGDAVSDMLCCLAIMQVYNITPESWNGLYTDLPSKQTKVIVTDKSIIQCNENEMEVISPVALQVALNTIMSTVSAGRCFVRPSGTEDIVRIYAEADTIEGVKQLVDAATIAINNIVG
jgi:phosphoacetylglucosamine mutase